MVLLKTTCPVCGKNITQKGLNSHQEEKHSTEPRKFVCTICSYATNREIQLADNRHKHIDPKAEKRGEIAKKKPYRRNMTENEKGMKKEKRSGGRPKIIDAKILTAINGSQLEIKNAIKGMNVRVTSLVVTMPTANYKKVMLESFNTSTERDTTENLVEIVKTICRFSQETVKCRSIRKYACITDNAPKMTSKERIE